MAKPKAKRLTKAEQAAADAAASKAFLKEQAATWKAYERTTAYMCEQRRKPFDAEVCVAAWNAYIAVYDKYQLQRPLSPKSLDAFLPP